ncbi:MAG: hypothetical protein ACLGHE_09850 [Gammaproteobacteria bacterium]|mgnify:CR=1 FL=1
MAHSFALSSRSLIVLSLIMLTLGSVFWLGAQLEGQSAFPVANTASLSPMASTAASTAAAQPVSALPATTPAGERPATVVLTDDDKQHILPAFYEAAAKDIERMEVRLRQARQTGATAADISAMEEKLQKMHEIVRQARLRHPGY